MDEAHGLLHDALGRLSTVSDEDYAAAFDALIREVKAHFEDEEQAMEAIAFPGIACHRAQHAQALEALAHASLRVKAGELAEGREISGLFSQWLISHITTMDAMFAQVMRHAGAESLACAGA